VKFVSGNVNYEELEEEAKRGKRKEKTTTTTNNNNAELRKKYNVKDSWKMRKEEVGENLLMLIVVEAPSTLLLLYITGVRPPSTSLSTTPTKLLCSSI
jgi:hypothetical protein